MTRYVLGFAVATLALIAIADAEPVQQPPPEPATLMQQTGQVDANGTLSSASGSTDAQQTTLVPETGVAEQGPSSAPMTTFDMQRNIANVPTNDDPGEERGTSVQRAYGSVPVQADFQSRQFLQSEAVPAPDKSAANDARHQEQYNDPPEDTGPESFVSISVVLRQQGLASQEGSPDLPPERGAENTVTAQKNGANKDPEPDEDGFGQVRFWASED